MKPLFERSTYLLCDSAFFFCLTFAALIVTVLWIPIALAESCIHRVRTHHAH